MPFVNAPHLDTEPHVESLKQRIQPANCIFRPKLNTYSGPT